VGQTFLSALQSGQTERSTPSELARCSLRFELDADTLADAEFFRLHRVQFDDGLQRPHVVHLSRLEELMAFRREPVREALDLAAPLARQRRVVRDDRCLPDLDLGGELLRELRAGHAPPGWAG